MQPIDMDVIGMEPVDMERATAMQAPLVEDVRRDYRHFPHIELYFDHLARRVRALAGKR